MIFQNPGRTAGLLFISTFFVMPAPSHRPVSRQIGRETAHVRSRPPLDCFVFENICRPDSAFRQTGLTAQGETEAAPSEQPQVNCGCSDGDVKPAGRNMGSRPADIFNGKTLWTAPPREARVCHQSEARKTGPVSHMVSFRVSSRASAKFSRSASSMFSGGKRRRVRP